MNAPTMMINKINSTNIIAAPRPFPHPQLFIIHSSFICLYTYILRKNFFLVLGFYEKFIKILKLLFFPILTAIIILGGK
jgi:hypothetical protein